MDTCPELEQLPANVSLRAPTDQDQEFLFNLFLETSADLLSQLPLPQEEKHQLTKIQFQAREQGWRLRYQSAAFRIIRVKNDRAGYFAYHSENEKFHLIYLGLLKTYQNRGIAAALVRKLQEIANSMRQPVVAHVESINSAKLFWKHLGFNVMDTCGPYESLRWEPES